MIWRYTYKIKLNFMNLDLVHWRPFLIFSQVVVKACNAESMQTFAVLERYLTKLFTMKRLQCRWWWRCRKPRPTRRKNNRTSSNFIKIIDPASRTDCENLMSLGLCINVIQEVLILEKKLTTDSTRFTGSKQNAHLNLPRSGSPREPMMRRVKGSTTNKRKAQLTSKMATTKKASCILASPKWCKRLEKRMCHV